MYCLHKSIIVYAKKNAHLTLERHMMCLIALRACLILGWSTLSVFMATSEVVIRQGNH